MLLPACFFFKYLYANHRCNSGSDDHGNDDDDDNTTQKMEMKINFVYFLAVRS